MLLEVKFRSWSRCDEPLVGAQRAVPLRRARTILFLQHLRQTGIESSDSARTAATNFRIRVQYHIDDAIHPRGCPKRRQKARKAPIFQMDNKFTIERE
jgi:hypothetical protein